MLGILRRGCSAYRHQSILSDHDVYPDALAPGYCSLIIVHCSPHHHNSVGRCAATIAVYSPWAMGHITHCSLCQRNHAFRSDASFATPWIICAIRLATASGVVPGGKVSACTSSSTQPPSGAQRPGTIRYTSTVFSTLQFSDSRSNCGQLFTPAYLSTTAHFSLKILSGADR